MSGLAEGNQCPKCSRAAVVVTCPYCGDTEWQLPCRCGHHIYIISTREAHGRNNPSCVLCATIPRVAGWCAAEATTARPSDADMVYFRANFPAWTRSAEDWFVSCYRDIIEGVVRIVWFASVAEWYAAVRQPPPSSAEPSSAEILAFQVEFGSDDPDVTRSFVSAYRACARERAALIARELEESCGACVSAIEGGGK